MTHEYLAGPGFLKYKENINDLGYSVWQEVSQTIEEFAPDVIGISSKSQNFKSAINTAEIAKTLVPEVKIIMGGPHPSLVKEKVLEFSCVDIVVLGEGEITFFELMEAFEHNAGFEKIEGIAYKKNAQVFVNEPRTYISDLGLLPNPYKYVKETLKDFNQYPKHAFRSVFSTRGCPFNCSFCGSHAIWSRKVRFRPVEHVIEEILFLKKLGVSYFNFDDDTFGVTKNYLHELCYKIGRQCKGILWSAEIHVKLIDNDVLTAMKDAGCDLIKIGIESGNNTILKEINKHITIEEAIEAAESITKKGMHVMSFFMVGFPQETEETLNDTLSAIKAIKGYTTYGIFTPYIGTQAFEQCLALGMISENFDVSLYNHQSPDNSFSKNIPHDRFRILAKEIERVVDEKNRKYQQSLKRTKLHPLTLIKKAIRRLKRLGS